MLKSKQELPVEKGTQKGHASVTPAELSLEQLIDVYARLSLLIKEAETEKEKYRKALDKLNLKAGAYPGNTHVLTVSAVVNKSIDPGEVRSKLADDKFMKVIKIIKAELEKYMLAEDIESCSVEKGTSLRYQVGEKQ